MFHVKHGLCALLILMLALPFPTLGMDTTVRNPGLFYERRWNYVEVGAAIVTSGALTRRNISFWSTTTRA